MGAGTDGSEPSTTDSDLGDEVIRKAFRSEEDAGTGTGEFTMRLLSGEANGNEIREIGLFDSSGALYARFNFASISKTNDFEVQFEVTAEVRNP